MTTRALVRRLWDRARCRTGAALAALTDAQLLEGIARLRRGQPSGIDLASLVPPDPEIAALTDAEIVRRLAAMRTQIVNNPHHRHTMEE